MPPSTRNPRLAGPEDGLAGGAGRPNEYGCLAPVFNRFFASIADECVRRSIRCSTFSMPYRASGAHATLCMKLHVQISMACLLRMLDISACVTLSMKKAAALSCFP